MASEVLSEPEQLRDWLVAQLAASADFVGTKVLSRKTARLQNEIERGLNSLGVSIVVILPDAKLRPSQGKVATLDQRIIIRVAADELLNKTGKSAHYFATRVVARFYNERPPFTFIPGVLRIEDPDMRELNILSGNPEEEEAFSIAAWDVFFRCPITLRARA